MARQAILMGVRRWIPPVLLVSAALLPGLAQAAIKVLVFGDSLVAGYGLGPDEGFVPQLQKALDAAGVDAQLINAGVTGDTTQTALDRLDWALGDQPDAVLVELGANDMLQGLPPVGIRENLSKVLERLKADDLPVLLAGMQANRSLGPDYTAAFDPIYPELAAQYGTALYPFFLEGVALDPKLNLSDGVHPTAEGIAIIVKAITPAVVELVDRAAQKGGGAADATPPANSPG